jgi:hypothetical protein
MVRLLKIQEFLVRGFEVMLCLVQCYWLEFLGDNNLNFELFEHFPFVFSSTFEYQTCLFVSQQESGEIWEFLAQ